MEANNQELMYEETAEAEYWNGLADAMDRLKNNPDFVKVFLEGYMKDAVVRQTSMLATQHVIQNNLRPQIMERLVAISHFEDYINLLNDMRRSEEDESEFESDEG